jgi:GNAT superfamily N-acetyltransferase
MPQFTPVSVTDAGALALLTQYFSDRESSFPSAQGTYRTTFPSPEQFMPPRGVFLLVSGDEGSADEGSADAGSADAAGATDAGGVAFLGCGGIRRIDDAPGGVPRFEVKHIFLQPQARGRGWGRALLDELERRARELGAGEIVLDTNASLEAAGALYTRSGYEDAPPYNDNPNATNWYRKRLE